MSKNKNSAVKSARPSTKNTSQDGVKGTVGAPRKVVKYPQAQSGFTVERAVEMNPDVCELTIRKSIKRDVKAGVLVNGDLVPKKDGEFGRCKQTYIVKSVLTAKSGSPKPARPSTKTPKKVVTPVVNDTPTPEPVATTETVESVEVPAPVSQIA